MKKVYVPQIPSRYDHDIGCWVPTVNMDPAKSYGELVVLLPPQGAHMEPHEFCKILTRGLEQITPSDWLMATGDPAIMGIAFTLAARRLDGLLRILRWDKRAQSYQPVEIRV